MPRLTTAKADLWDVAVTELAQRNCRYRIRRRDDRPFIRIREMADGAVLREFSAQPLRHNIDEHITAARDLCLKAHSLGTWPLDAKAMQEMFGDYKTGAVPTISIELNWRELADQVAANVCDRIVKEASRTHLLNHLTKRVRNFSGVVTGERLEQWVMEVDPSTSRSSFDKRLDTLSQIHKTGLLDLTAEMSRLRNLRPTGAAERVRKATTMRVRVIPSDQAIEEWLDELEPFERWVYGALATYGLRPHELWHATAPDHRGWITVPGDLQTKTHTHHVPPVPKAWVERYHLRDRWGSMQEQLKERWPIRFSTKAGVAIPVNNAALGQYLYKQFTLRSTPKLIAPLAEGEGTDWVRPYDLRHAYAIRCAVHPETAHAFDDDMAAWMGHGIDVHQRIYLRWLPPSRKKESMQRRFEVEAHSPEVITQPATLDPEIASKLERLEALEAQLAALKGLL